MNALAVLLLVVGVGGVLTMDVAAFRLGGTLSNGFFEAEAIKVFHLAMWLVLAAFTGLALLVVWRD